MKELEDIEKDPRYKELLDEEARKVKCDGDTQECYSTWAELVQFEERFIIDKSKLSAQRRYFEEKLQEGKTMFLQEIEAWRKAMTEQKEMFVKAKEELSAVIAEKTKDADLMIASYRDALRESKTIIEEQKKEIELLKLKI